MPTGGFITTKDLSIFTSDEVKLSQILLIDNFIYNFAFNLENGIPVQHFWGEKNDQCLLQVMNYLEYIKDFDDLATENEEIYGFKSMFNSNIDEYESYYKSKNNTSYSEIEEGGEDELSEMEEEEQMQQASTEEGQSLRHKAYLNVNNLSPDSNIRKE